MGKKKTKTTSTETNHSVTTADNPEWVTSGAQGFASQIQGLSANSPYSYVAPLSSLEGQAGQAASGLGANKSGAASQMGSDAWLANLANSPTPSVSAASLLDNLESYSNPFQQRVTDAAMADFDADAGRTRAMQDLALAGQGAFGGSGAALTKSMTEEQLARTRNSSLANLLSQGFTTSANLSNLDAERRQQASTTNAQLDMQNRQWLSQLAFDQDANARANIASQAALGQQLRAQDQDYRNAPLTLLGKQTDMFSGLPLSLFQGHTTDSTGTSNSTQTQSGVGLSDVAGLVSSLTGFGGLLQSMGKLPKVSG